MYTASQNKTAFARPRKSLKKQDQEKWINPEAQSLHGWGTWTRTKTNGVRVRCSTLKLSPRMK